MRKVLTATEGHVYTNGEIYGKIIYLAHGVNASTFYEITDEEYEAIIMLEDELNENILDTTIIEKAKAYDILMGVSE